MKRDEQEQLTDQELSEMLASWVVPDPSLSLRSRIFPEFSDLRFMLPVSLDEPWFKSLWSSADELFRPQRQPPLEVTSKPVAVAGLWTTQPGRRSRSLAAAFALQSCTVALLLLGFEPQLVQPSPRTFVQAYVLPYRSVAPAVPKFGGGGGGGQHAPAPVAKGTAPKFAPKPFIPPAVAVPKPLLPAVPSVSAAAPQIDAPNYGDPLSKLADNSPGRGINGLGEGRNGGLGDGSDDGYGAGSGGQNGGHAYQPGGDISSPVLISKIDPEYSDEARKAKYSGMVMLSVVVDEHGIPRDIRVVRTLGLGLDQKAIEAVKQWRFRPGMRRGKPLPVLATVEVSFRLL